MVDGMLLLQLRCFHLLLYMRDKNSDLTGMASISRNFLSIYMAFFLGVLLNSYLKGNDCGSFPLTVYKKKPGRRVDWQVPNSALPLSTPLSKLPLKHPSWWCRNNATFLYIVLLERCLDWFSLKPKRTKFIISIC